MRISDWSSDVCSSEAALELGVGAAQRRFRIDVQVTRQVDDEEQQVADLVFQPLGRTALVDLGTNLADLFVQLVEHLAHLRQVEAHPRGPLLQLLARKSVW